MLIQGKSALWYMAITIIKSAFELIKDVTIKAAMLTLSAALNVTTGLCICKEKSVHLTVLYEPVYPKCVHDH